MEGRFVKAKIGRGVFDHERSFSLRVRDKMFSGIVDEGDVKGSDRLRVWVLDSSNEEVLVEFPRESANGQRAWLPKTMLAS